MESGGWLGGGKNCSEESGGWLGGGKEWPPPQILWYSSGYNGGKITALTLWPQLAIDE